MKFNRLAVFGHYDSRGGTTAFPISHPNHLGVYGDSDREKREGQRAEVIRAMSHYDINHFAFTPEGMGVSAEELATWSKPSHDDFLFVADLWCEDEEEEMYDVDLEENGYVLIDTRWEPAGMGPDGREMPWDLRLVTSLDQPVQLEFVRCSREELDFFNDIDEDVAHSIIKMKARQLDPLSKTLEVRRWDDDAFGFIVCEIPADWEPPTNEPKVEA